MRNAPLESVVTLFSSLLLKKDEKIMKHLPERSKQNLTALRTIH